MFLLALIFPVVGLYAQETIDIRGHVTDTEGNDLPGAAVMIKGAEVATGATSDVNGEYLLKGVPVGSSLEAQVIGFQSQTKKVTAGSNVINFILVPDAEEMEELTLVAFGRQKKESVVSSVTTVNVKDLRVPAHNFTSSFAGRIPGMISWQTSGEPGADMAQFFVRGVTTFGYGNSPLILIDGFESSTDDLRRLQVDDIESFSILKDASATALYGARGANGILLIVTKSGREGPAEINVRVDSHVATPTKMIETVDAIEYMRMYNEATVTRNPDAGYYYNEQQIQSTINNENPMIYPNVNWYDELFKKTTINNKAVISISGGGNVAKYYIAGGFENENGLLKKDTRNNFNTNISINRVHLRSNVIFNLTKNTTLDARIQAEFERYNGPYNSATSVFGMVLNSNPVDFPAVYDPDYAHQFTTHTLFGSTIVNGAIKQNPYAEMVRGYSSSNNDIVTAQATLNQNLDFITPGLKFEIKGSVKTSGNTSQSRYFIPFYYQWEGYNQVTKEYKLFCLNPHSSDAMGDISAGTSRDASYYFEARLNWGRKFNNLHQVDAMVVTIAQENANLVEGSIFSALPSRNLGLSGRFSYNYDSRYFGEFVFGYNGSEKFDYKRRWGFFPSFGAGWIVSNEKWFESAKKVVNHLKLRATYGISGNDAIAGAADRFNFLSQIVKGGAGYSWGELFNNYGGGYQILRYANPDITWEIGKKVNVGLEINMFGDFLRFQIDAFKDWRSQIYQERENFAATTGLIDPPLKIFGNVGKVETHGFEGSLDLEKNITKDAWVTGRFNFTYSVNKVTAKEEKNYRDRYLSAIGQSVNMQWGLVAERLFVDYAEIANSPRQDFGSYSAGDIKYKDINGDGVVNDNDRVPMGYPRGAPEFQYGFGLSGGWKNFDLSFFFQGNSRVSFFINPEGIAPLVDHRNAMKIVARDYWTETDPDAHAFWPRLSTTPIVNNTQISSWWLRNGTFLRLKTIEGGYTIKNLDKLFIKSGRIYFSIENVFYVSTFKLWDPEMGDSGLGYPPNRRFNIGLQLQF
jgi:TonB-linked SusC/RagA family outer membrane protein